MKSKSKNWMIWAAMPVVTGLLLVSCAKSEQDAVELTAEETYDLALMNGELKDFVRADLVNCLDTFPYEELSDEEVEAILQMREEELLAKDVYSFLYPVWSVPVFNNISKSEEQHTTMVKALIDKYELPDPGENHQPGVFVNLELQMLYDSLTVFGSNSLIDGLTVGATIEDLDIYDLNYLIEEVVDNQDVTWVFENLCRGSRNHMRAFYRNLVFRGADYVPQFISMEYFLEIINGQHEPGSGGCGCSFMN